MSILGEVNADTVSTFLGVVSHQTLADIVESMKSKELEKSINIFEELQS